MKCALNQDIISSNIIKSEADLTETGPIGTAEWQHGHKTVPETFSHVMIHSAHTCMNTAQHAAQLAEKGSQSTKGIPVFLGRQIVR